MFSIAPGSRGRDRPTVHRHEPRSLRGRADGYRRTGFPDASKSARATHNMQTHKLHAPLKEHLVPVVLIWSTTVFDKAGKTLRRSVRPLAPVDAQAQPMIRICEFLRLD
jgi:hypothetical protein